jgi:hypothetical protein
VAQQGEQAEMTNMETTVVTAEDRAADRAGDIDFALYDCGFTGTDVAEKAVALAVMHLKRDPRFAALTISQIEDLLHNMRRDLEEDVACWIADWIHQIERAAL